MVAAAGGRGVVDRTGFRREPRVAARQDCPRSVVALGRRLVGRVPALIAATGDLGPATLVHGDAALGNVLASEGGELAFVDWEDVGAAPGVCDLAWLLVSSVEPDGWGEVEDAYGPVDGLDVALLESASQGILSVASSGGSVGSVASVGSEVPAGGWMRRLEAVARRTASS